MGRGGTPPLSPPVMGDMRDVTDFLFGRIDSCNTTESVCLNEEQFDNVVEERNVSSMVTTFAW